MSSRLVRRGRGRTTEAVDDRAPPETTPSATAAEAPVDNSLTADARVRSRTAGWSIHALDRVLRSEVSSDPVPGVQLFLPGSFPVAPAKIPPNPPVSWRHPFPPTGAASSFSRGARVSRALREARSDLLDPRRYAERWTERSTGRMTHRAPATTRTGPTVLRVSPSLRTGESPGILGIRGSTAGYGRQVRGTSPAPWPPVVAFSTGPSWRHWAGPPRPYRRRHAPASRTVPPRHPTSGAPSTGRRARRLRRTRTPRRRRPRHRRPGARGTRGLDRPWGRTHRGQRPRPLGTTDP